MRLPLFLNPLLVQKDLNIYNYSFKNSEDVCLKCAAIKTYIPTKYFIVK